MATREMRHLHQLNQVLTSAGGAAQVGSSSTIDGGLLPLVAPDATPPTIDRIVKRERWIAAAVDARYARLRTAVTSRTSPISGAVLDKLVFILDTGPDHTGALVTSIPRVQVVLDSRGRLGERIRAASGSRTMSPRRHRAVAARPGARLQEGGPWLLLRPASWT